MTERFYLIAHKDLEISKQKTVGLKDIIEYSINMFSEYQYAEKDIFKALDSYDSYDLKRHCQQTFYLKSFSHIS